MGSAGLKEIHLAGSLYDAYRDRLIPPTPDFDRFVESHKAFQTHLLRTGFIGMLLMPLSTYYLYKNIRTPGIKGGIGLGLCTFYVLFVMPDKPPKEEMEFVRREAPKYLHILVQKEPGSEAVFREVLGISKENEGMLPGFRSEMTGGDREKRGEMDWEKSENQSQPANIAYDFPENRDLKDGKSPYLTPTHTKSDKPYVYGSLSDPRDRS